MSIEMVKNQFTLFYPVAEYMKGAMAVGLAIRHLVIDDVEVRLKPDMELTEDELVEDVN